MSSPTHAVELGVSQRDGLNKSASSPHVDRLACRPGVLMLTMHDAGMRYALLRKDMVTGVLVARDSWVTGGNKRNVSYCILGKSVSRVPYRT